MEKDYGFIGGGSVNVSEDFCGVKNLVKEAIRLCRASEKNICKNNAGLISNMFIGKMYDGYGNLVTVEPYRGD